MRDIALTIGILGLLPVCLLRPWVGMLVWAWLAYMSPHRFTWGFAHDFAFAQLVGLATLVGFVFTRERRAFVWSRETITLLLLWLWFTVTTVFAWYPDAAWEQWEKTSKILLMTLLTVPLFQDRKKLRMLVMVMALSIGFFGFKGGLFAVATGGQYRVLGPPQSFFSENNELALALNMCVPMLLYLAREEPHLWRRRLLRACFGLTVLAVPFTYSRGGLLGLVAVLGILFLNSRRRWLILPVAAVVVAVFVSVAPPRWFARVQTLEDYSADESAQLRLMSWRVAYEIAKDYPLVGGGFRVLTDRQTYNIYLPEYPRAFGHDAHSIYFNLLAEHGWIGLGLFGALMCFSLLTLRRLSRQGSRQPELAWLGGYADMLTASLIAYLVNGAFLSVAYFDLAYQMLILVPVLSALAAGEPAPVPVARPAIPMRQASRLLPSGGR
jgi:probable O-glycosylation ligase (exosortase A-associated)